MAKIPPRLERLLKKAENLIGSVDSRFDGGTVYTVDDMLRSALSLEEDREKRVQISHLLSDLKEYYHSMPSSAATADTQVIVRNEQTYAYLTLLPARRRGRSLPAHEIEREVATAGVTHGIVPGLIEAAAQKTAKKGEAVWNLQIACCTLPQRGTDATIKFTASSFDKSLFFGPVPPPEDWSNLVQIIETGEKVAEIEPAGEGKSGTDVRGEEIPAVPGEDIKLRLGAGMRVGPDKRGVAAMRRGALVLGEDDANIVPFEFFPGNIEPAEKELLCDGNILVAGSVFGPLTLRAQDIYVGGNVENVSVFASNDIFVRGEIAGGKGIAVEAGGRIHAGSVRETRMQAEGEIVIRDMAADSDVASRDRVRVTGGHGVVAGGNIAGLKGVEARNVGPGMGSDVILSAGIDAVSVQRRRAFEEKVRDLEKEAEKLITDRSEYEKPGVTPAALSVEDQDRYLELLEEARKVHREIERLKDAAEQAGEAWTMDAGASIRIGQKLLPPAKLVIAGSSMVVKQETGSATFVLDQDNRIREG